MTGAQGYANADLAGALADEIRDDAVDADAGKQERKSGKNAEQDHGEAARRQRGSDNVIHGLRLVDHLFAVDLLIGAAKRFEQGGGGLVGPDHQERAAASGYIGHVVVGHLQAGQVELRAQGLREVGVQAPLVDVADHADDLHARSVGGEIQRVQAKRLSDGVFVAEVLPRENVVHDSDDG